MFSHVLRRPAALAPSPSLLSCLICLWAAALGHADGLTRLDVTQAGLSPGFTPNTTSYAAALPADAAAAAVQTLPAAASSRLFLQAANAPWQQVARGATVAAGANHSLVLRIDGTVLAWGSNSHGQTTLPAAAQAGVTALAAGANHSLALGEDGSVIAWGDNGSGQCTVPAQALAGIVAIAAGGNQSLALTAKGAVLAWGGGATSQLPPSLTSGVVALAAGQNHGLALTAAGSVVAWGNTPPPPLLAGSDVVSIAAGSDRSLALRRDGTIVIWGYASATLLSVPAAAQGAVALAASDIHNFALRADGSVFAWSTGGSGPLDPPATVASDVVAIAAGTSHAHALKRDGSLVSWGTTSFGLTSPPLPARNSLRLPVSAALPVAYGSSRIGLRVAPIVAPSTSTVPLASLRGRGLSSAHGPTGVLRADGGLAAWNGAPTPPSPANLAAISYGIFHGLGLKADGSLTTWGGASTAILTAPGDAIDLVAVSAGPYHSLALRRDGRVIAWGEASSALLTTPASVRSGVVAISASASVNLALKSDGSVVSWGTSSYSAPASTSADVVAISAGLQNALALKSDGSLIVWGNPTHPVATQVPAEATSLVAISAGSTHALALRSDGRVVAWGNNGYGQCTVPAAAETGIVAISAGPDFSLAVKSDGSLVSWGSPGTIPPLASTGLLLPPASSNIQITSTPDLLAPRVPLAAGDGFTVALRDTGTPAAWGYLNSSNTPPAGLTNLVGLVARDGYTLALRPDGTVTGWGPNNFPPLTIPSTAQSGVVALAVGAGHALALKADGRVVAWGSNSSGQTAVPELNPGTTASNGYLFTAIAAADSTSFGLRSDGRVIAWGSSAYGLATVPAAAQSDVVAIAAGYRHALALKRDGSVVGWGDSTGGANASFTPAVPVVALAAGDSFSLYLFADGTVSGVGSNNFFVPSAASGNVVALAAGRMHASVLKADGTVYSWGSISGTAPSPLVVLRPGPMGDDYRVTLTRAYPDPALADLRLGAAPLTPDFTPATTLYTQSVSSDSGVLGLALDPATSAASVQISINGAPPRTSLPGPALLMHPNGPDALGLTPWGAFTSTNSSLADTNYLPAAAREGLLGLAFANNRAIGLTREGALVAWVLGNSSLEPVPSALSRGIVQIASTASSVLALLADGSVREWSPGNLSLDFVPPELASGVVRIAARNHTRLALLSDGSVYSWGNINSPPFAASSGVVAIHAGDGLAFAQKADGSVLLWGSHSAALGDLPPALSTGIVSLVADSSTAQAVLADGSVISWGENVTDLQPPAAARSGVISLAAANLTRVAQKTDGTLVFWNTYDSQVSTATLALASPRAFPLALRQGANRVSFRVAPVGRPLSAAPIATGYYRHYAVSSAGAVMFRNASTGSTGTPLPAAASSGIASVFSGGYGDFALTTVGRLVALNGAFIPSQTQPSSSGETPVRAPVASLAVGNNFAVLLRTDGSTYQWGSLSSMPADAQSGIAAIAAGANHALALRADGRVVAWSYNSLANIVPGAALSDVVAIAASSDTSLALKADGSVVQWGSGYYPYGPAGAPTGVVGIAINEGQALALKTDGSVVAWGPDATQYPPPAAVSSGVIALFASGRHQIALKADGSTVTWGRHVSGGTLMPADFGGSLLAAPVRDYHLTVAVASLPGLLALGASPGALDPAFAPANYSYALPSTPYATLALPALSANPGDELALRVGPGPFETRAAGPALAVSYGSLLALRPDGTVRAFSGDSVGSLPLAAQSGVATLAAGEFHAFALKRDGSLVGWGQNSSNILSTMPAGTGFVAVASGAAHGLALRRDGSISAWGSNNAMQLQVPAAAADCVAVSAGEYTSMALRRDGAVVAWGRHTSTPQTIPADAQSGVVAIAAGRDHYLALRADGRVVQWGNTFGFTEAAPFRFVAIAAFHDQNIGLRPDGEIVSWGGFSGSFLALTPTTSIGAIAIAAGPNFAAALRADGSLFTIPATGSGFSHLNGTSDFAGPFALPISAPVPLALGDNTVELRVSRPDSGLPSATYAFNLARLAAPGLRLGAGPLAELAGLNPYYHDFGPQRLGATSPSQLFTLLNTGTADLVVSTASLSGPASADFSLSGLSVPLTLAPGASTTFTATATPSGAGSRYARLILGANLPNDEPAGFTLRAEGISFVGDRNSWRATQFSSADLADPALEATLWGDLADPDADGIPNLLEYATGTDARIANAAPAPLALDPLAPGGPRLTLAYQRRIRAAVGGLVFRIEWSDTLSPGSWSADGVTETVTGTQGLNETVVASVPAGAPRRFLRLRVTAP